MNIGIKILSPSGNTRFSQEELRILRETIGRIGTIGKKDKKFVNVICGILIENGKCRILHFKEGFLNEGKESKFTEQDMLQRNFVAVLLEEWGLCKIDEEDLEYSNVGVSVIKHSEKSNYTFKHWYRFGSK